MCFVNNLYFQKMSFRGKNTTRLELIPFSIDKHTEFSWTSATANSERTNKK